MDDGTVYSSTARVGAKCGRWNPTAEQVKVLTELFRSGLRTPTTDQIQMISSNLSALGKIESKNVFYWFQNHKARERHSKKRRRAAPPAAADNRRVDRDATTNRSCCMAMEQQEVVWEEGREREVVETLELFPLSSYDTAEDHDKVIRSQWKEMAYFDMNGRDLVLDLSLS